MEGSLSVNHPGPCQHITYYYGVKKPHKVIFGISIRHIQIPANCNGETTAC